jgi:hypothetical protein
MDLPFILVKIDQLHNMILAQQRHNNLIYDVSENSSSGNFFQHGTTSLDIVANNANGLLLDHICFLRKLESFYIHYHPEYVRKPNYQYAEE